MGCIEGTLPLGAGATFCRRGARPLRRSRPDDGRRREAHGQRVAHELPPAARLPRPVHERERLGARRGDRILSVFKEADCRVAWLVTSDADGARTFLGPLARQFLTYIDPDRTAVRGMGLDRLPALVWLKTDLTIGGAAEGWEPAEWKTISDNLAEMMSWKGPLIPDRGDPRRVRWHTCCGVDPSRFSVAQSARNGRVRTTEKAVGGAVKPQCPAGRRVRAACRKPSGTRAHVSDGQVGLSAPRRSSRHRSTPEGRPRSRSTRELSHPRLGRRTTRSPPTLPTTPTT